MPDSLIDKSDCPKHIQYNFLKNVLKLEGEVNTLYLAEAFKDDYDHYELSISPKKVSITHLNSFLSSKTQLPEGHLFSDSKFVSGESYLGLDQEDDIQVTCPNCQDKGNKHIKISILHARDKRNKTLWVTSILKTKILALKAITNCPAFAHENMTNCFEGTETETVEPGQYFTDKEILKYFKLNRPISLGHYLKHTDLSANLIVRSGQRVKVKLIQDNLTLTTAAVARTSGRWGDEIPLVGLGNRKEIIGKVIDFNTVRVDL